MRVAYADPPYPGQARRHYKMPEVDHASITDGAHHKQYDILSALQVLIPDKGKWKDFYEAYEPSTGIPA